MFWEFIPLSSKYIVKRLKKSPNGSDLNHPTIPLIIIGTDNEKKSAAKRPAVVPPITLTKPKITIVVNDPIITGNIIVKLYRSVEPLTI